MTSPPTFQSRTQSESSVTTSPGPSPGTYESLLKAPVAEGFGVASKFHAADILAPPKDALFHPRAFPDEALGFMPFVANKPWMATTRLTPRHFTCLTIGSRGDIQPYIALGLRLMQDGHNVTIVTHGEPTVRFTLMSDEFKGWIEGYGMEHRQAGGDPTALMRLSTEHKVSHV